MSVLATDPQHLGSLLDLAGLYKDRGLLCEARDVLERAVQSAPHDLCVCEALATVITDLGTAAKSAGRLDEAVHLYQTAIMTYPSLAAAHYNLVSWSRVFSSGVLSEGGGEQQGALEAKPGPPHHWPTLATPPHHSTGCCG